MFNLYRYIAYALIVFTLTACGSAQPAEAAQKAQSIQFLLSQVRASGVALSGGKVDFYEAGATTTRKTVWIDRNKATPAANPYTLDSNGTAALFGDGLYRIVIKDSAGVTKYDRDNISIRDISGNVYDVSDYASLNAAVTAIGSTPATLQFASDTTVTANLVIPSTLELMPLNGAKINHTTYTISHAGSTARWPLAQVFNGAGAVTLSVGNPVSAAWFGVVNNESTDNTTAVQKALNAAKGAPVAVPDGAYFDLSALTFPDNDGSAGYYVLDYRANDDTSSPTHPSGNATNERIRFVMNNNSSGYNNEVQISSGYSTGLMLDVRRDVDAPNIGAGQDQQYGRTSVVWAQDGLTRTQMKYTDSAGDTSSPGLDDGWTVQFIEPRMTLNNIKASSFVATLALNNMVKGATSGARGWVKAIGASSITVTLLSGKFVAGEAVILEPAVETTTDTIISVTGPTNTSRSNRLGFSAKQIGNMFTNIQGDDAVYPLNVGGAIGIQQSGTTNGAYTNPELFLEDKLSAATKSVRVQMETATGDAVVLVNNVAVMRLKVGGEAKIYGGVESTGGITTKQATTAQLADITHPINTTNKLNGMMIYNLTTDKPVWSSGTAAGDVWKDATGATAHTPI